MALDNIDELKRIMDELRMLPENADYITAYGNWGNQPELDGLYPLEEFAEAIYDEELEDLKILRIRATINSEFQNNNKS